jgi:cell division protein FtsB
VSHPLLSQIVRWKAPLLIAASIGVYLWIAISGPQGVQTLVEKHREIRQLEERNAETARENERRKDRIRRLAESQSEQEMEIRKQLKLLRPGETMFILPNAPAEDSDRKPTER